MWPNEIVVFVVKSAQNIVFYNKVFSFCGRGRDERIKFLVSFIQLYEAGVSVLILWFELKFCENGAFIFE
jgi:hypothetical protein